MPDIALTPRTPGYVLSLWGLAWFLFGADSGRTNWILFFFPSLLHALFFCPARWWWWWGTIEERPFWKQPINLQMSSEHQMLLHHYVKCYTEEIRNISLSSPLEAVTHFLGRGDCVESDYGIRGLCVMNY